MSDVDVWQLLEGCRDGDGTRVEFGYEALRDAIEAALRLERAAERAAIVAWLRAEVTLSHPLTPNNSSYVEALGDAAKLIERGDHVKNDDTYTMSFAKDPDVLSVQRKIWEKK